MPPIHAEAVARHVDLPGGVAESAAMHARLVASWLVHLSRRLGACFVHSKPLLTPIEPVRPDHLWQPEERGGVGSVFAGRMLEVPGAAEVVLRSRAADRWPLAVTVEVELDLTLAPPTS